MKKCLVILAAVVSAAVACGQTPEGLPAGPDVVVLAMDVELDQVSPLDAAQYRVGGHDLDRIACDKTKIDPVTREVPIAYLAHNIHGRWMPTTPTDASRSGAWPSCRGRISPC